MKTRILTAIIIVGGLLSYTNGLLACTRPTAILYGSPSQTFVGNQVHLDGSYSYSTDGRIAHYKWNFDYINNPNNWVEDASIITHIYQTPGRYTVALKVVSVWNVESIVTSSSQFTVDVNDIIYVNEQSQAGNDGDGFTWATAFNNLQSALDDANVGVQIWVAQGTYIPSRLTVIENPRTATFKLANGVRLYGGFSGTETSIDQRDWQAYPTVLSGDLTDNDENAYHVVTGSGTNATAVLDGFAIIAGNANSSDPYYSGGGMYNSSGSPTVNNCGFSYNNANEGGGVYNNVSEPNFTNCTFSINTASVGAGVCNRNGKGTFIGCVFSDHTDSSSAMYNTGGASPLIKDCAFTNNSNYSYGSAIYNDSNSGPYSPQITNCVFAGNRADSGGGAIYLSTNCHAVITNCVFNNNSGDELGYDGYGGGAIYNYGGEPDINNCIFWGNRASQGGEIANYSGTIKMSYCDIDTSKTFGTITYVVGNINADPRFADVCNPAGLDGIFFTDDDGLQLEPNSPCIDVCPISGSPDKDILGQDRDVNIPFVGSDTTIVDMGAYEVQRPVWHVKQNSTGSNNGIGWNNAFNYIQDALAAARMYGGDIWVAAGTYKPDENSVNSNGTGYRDANFALITGVGLYGGFDGNETMFSRRDPARNETILSGDINESSNNDSYNIVIARDVNNTAILAGFTITDGNAFIATFPFNRGGGMYDYNASPTIIDCNFKNNKAYYYGGAICNESNSSPVIARCLFINNEANATISSFGGAIYNIQSSPKINNCAFINNIAKRGGGAIGNSQSSPTLFNCAFNGNTATSSTGLLGIGGAVHNTTTSSPVMTNCVFTANSAKNGGGIYNTTSSSPNLVNCTFNKNSATGTGSYGYGGGMCTSLSCSPVVTNCIFWGNTAVSGSNEVNNCATQTFKNCDIKGCMTGGSWNTILGTDGGGNIDVDPNFADANNPAGLDGIFGTSDDGLQLQIFDPNLTSCVDAADGNTAPAADLRGHGRIDLEFMPNTGSGEPNYADMGAYEYDDTPGYTTSFEINQGYEYDGSESTHAVDGWKVEEGSHTISGATYVNPNDTSNPHQYQYDQVSSNSKISYEAAQPHSESTIRISCIPSPGSYINVMNGSAKIASIRFGAGDDANTYVWDNGAYKKASMTPDYNQVATQCRRFLSGNDTNPPYSYENTWIDFTIKFNWVNHSYDVSWRNYAVPNGAAIYSGAVFYSGYNYYTKVEFITGENDIWNSKLFNINRMSFSDAAVEGGVIAPDEDIWLIAPQANLKDPLKGRCAIVGPMWYDKLGQYIVSACPSDLDPNDANSWMQVCSGRTVSKYATTLGYWNTAAFYNGDYFLKIQVYDDIGRLTADANIMIERTFNGRTRMCKATYPIIGRFKPQTYTYQDLPDFKINWPGSFPFEFQRMYNSAQSSRLYPLFYGWTHNHNIRLIEDASFDWIKDASEKPVGDNKKLGIGKLWLCLPSGGGLYVGHVDDTNTNNVIYEPTDKSNQRIVRTVNYINNPGTTSDVNVTYVYYAPDGRKMTFNKAFSVGYPVPADENLIDWMAVTGIDKQEDRFGNTLEYAWDTSETCLQQISNNRTPAKLVLTYGMPVYRGFYAHPFLCKEIRIYNGDEPTEAFVTLSGDIEEGFGSLGYSALRSYDGDHADYYMWWINTFTYSEVGKKRDLVAVGAEGLLVMHGYAPVLILTTMMELSQKSRRVIISQRATRIFIARICRLSITLLNMMTRAHLPLLSI